MGGPDQNASTGDHPAGTPDPSLVTPAPQAEGRRAARRRSFRRRRTWGQRLVLALNLLVVLACFGGAVSLWYLSEKANDSKVVTLERPRVTTAPPTGTDPTGPVDSQAPAPEVPELVDKSARNFLITGTDNGACVDPASPYAGAFGERFGDRTDTIMMIRIDPGTSRAAVLSFPRDLWVKISGSSRYSRINSAFNKDDPTTLIYTIYENFGIIADHYINIDFCAFKQIVDAVGGVNVPFLYAVKDDNTGLNVPGPMCYPFDGESGLAYVRSRHFSYLDPATGRWREDPTSDFGRISRQQDFMTRLLQRALDSGARDPRIVKEIMDAALQFVTRDDALTIGKLLQFAQAMKNLQPGTIQNYQIEAYPMVVSGQAVLDPRVQGDNMQAVLAVFTGQTQLAAAPEQVFDSTTTSTTPTTTQPSSGTGATTTTAPGTGSATTTTSTLPQSTAVENSKGIVPPDDPTCR